MSSTETSFGVRKGLPYTDFLNIEVGKLRENGMIKNYLKRDDYHLPCPGHDDSNGVFPIIIKKVVLAFSILFIGVIISVFFIFLEILANLSAFGSLYSFFWPWNAIKSRKMDKTIQKSFQETRFFERLIQKTRGGP